jgi:hypothetical protein
MSITPDSYIPILTAIGFGGIISALITFFANSIIKRREQYLDIAKYKIDAISKSKQYVIQLARCYNTLSGYLLQARTGSSSTLIMYYMCKILALQSRIFEEVGEMQFDALEAERVIDHYRRKVGTSLLPDFGHVEMYRLADLVKESDGTFLSPDKFIKKYDEERALYSKFEEWLNKLPPEKLKELVINCKMFYHLTILELNNVYKVWYKDFSFSSGFKKLDQDLKDRLKQDDPCYYCRVSTLRIPWIGKEICRLRFCHPTKHRK